MLYSGPGRFKTRLDATCGPNHSMRITFCCSVRIPISYQPLRAPHNRVLRPAADPSTSVQLLAICRDENGCDIIVRQELAPHPKTIHNYYHSRGSLCVCAAKYLVQFI